MQENLENQIPDATSSSLSLVSLENQKHFALSVDQSIQEKFKETLEECERLRAENEKLRKQLELQEADQAGSQKNSDSSQSIPAVHNQSSSDEKVALFRSFFRGRDDVYALR